ALPAARAPRGARAARERAERPGARNSARTARAPSAPCGRLSCARSAPGHSFAQRQRDGEGRTFAGGAVDADLAAMQLDELLRQCKAEPGAFRLLAGVAPDLPELLEQRRLVFSRDADAGVLDRDLDLGRVELRAHVHAPAV